MTGTPRLRIAHLCGQFSRHGDGVARSVVELVERQSPRHEVHLLAIDVPGAAPRNVTVHRTEVPRPAVGPLWLPAHMASAGRTLACLDVDIRHIHLPCFARADVISAHLFPAVWSLRALKRAYGGARGDLGGRNRLRLALRAAQRPLYRYNYGPGRYRRVIAVSGKVRAALCEHYGIPSGRVSVAPLGVDVDAFRNPAAARERETLRRRYGIAPDTYLFVFVGHQFVVKGLGFVLDALGRLTDHDVHLLVVGRGFEGTDRLMRRRAEEAGLGRRVTFAGEQSDAAPFYWASDALVLPSVFESFGLAVLEAMAAGLPVITTAGVGCVGELSPGAREAMCLVDSAADVPALAGAMAGLTAAPEAAASRGAVLREEARAFTWERYHDRVMEIYREVLAEKADEAARGHAV